jgi:maltooligosyltrehalose trehalohydrolase
LIEAVRRGRGEEFKAFEWKGELPDPQDEATFLRSKLRHELRYQGGHRVLREFYKELIRLRKTVPPLSSLNKEQMEVWGYEEEKILFIRRWIAKGEVSIIFNFDDSAKSVVLPLPAGEWRKQLDSEEESWGGRGSAVPVRLQSGGQMPISLAGKAFILLVQGAEEA